MSVIDVRKMGDPVLREKAKPVEKFDSALRRLADDMLETMYAANGLGLAAPQIGVSSRIFVLDEGEGPRTIVNPMLSAFEGEQTADEGCLSLPGLYFPVTRALSVRLDAFDVEGNPVGLDSAELLARILQHETDHIDGILFIDRLSDEHRREALKQFREQELGLAAPEVEPSRAL